MIDREFTLRLAKLLKDHLEGDRLWIDVRDEVRALVRDLEAAPKPERRTITREEYDKMRDKLELFSGAGAARVNTVAAQLLNTLRLTVEG